MLGDGRRATFQLQRVGQVQREYRHAVEHRQAQQGHARARREHVRILTPESHDANLVLVPLKI